MTEDFNPFDLSAHAQQAKAAKAQAKPDDPKAMVQRVSVGPLLHSRFVRVIVLFGLTFIFAAAGYGATLYWISRTK